MTGQICIYPAVVFSVAITCCTAQSSPHLRPRLREQIPAQSLIEESTHILVGRVVATKSVTSVITIDQGPSRIQMHRVLIQTELAIKGGPTPGQLFFYRFDCVEGCKEWQNLSWLPLNSRRIFFLVEDNGTFRATVDISDSTFPVFSRPDTLVNSNEDSSHAVARILLRVSADSDPTAFTTSLFNARAIAQDLVGRSEQSTGSGDSSLELLCRMVRHGPAPGIEH